VGSVDYTTSFRVGPVSDTIEFFGQIRKDSDDIPGIVPAKCSEDNWHHVTWSGENLIALSEQHHSKLVSFKQCVELLGKVDGVAGIAETGFLVLGARIRHQNVLSFEIDGLIIVEHGPDIFTTQNLIALVVGFVYVLNQYRGLGSGHNVYFLSYCYTLFMLENQLTTRIKIPHHRSPHSPWLRLVSVPEF